MAKALRAIVLMTGTLLLGCDNPECSTETQKVFVHDLMSNVYLWADQTPAIRFSDFSTPEQLFEAMAYREVDRWSAFVPAAPYLAYFQHGEAVGFGYSTTFDANGQMRITWVVADSPAGDSGMKRGDTLLEIGGESITDIVHNNLWAEVMGPNEKGATVVHRVRDISGNVADLTIAKDVVEVDRVPVTQVFPSENGNIGYLLFMGFVGPAEQDLRIAFDELREADVKSMIVDLRYNGGGYVYLAGLLGSLLAGSERAGEVLLHNAHNPNYSAWDSDMKMTAEPQAVDISQVVFLTSGQTASASEIVINGLEPFMDVKLVGERTYGKPVGSDAWTSCDSIVSTVTFRSLNALGQGDYFGGIPVDCEVEDDLNHELGDPDELRLNAALHLTQTGSCQALSTASTLGVPLLDIKKAQRQLQHLVPPEMGTLR